MGGRAKDYLSFLPNFFQCPWFGIWYNIWCWCLLTTKRASISLDNLPMKFLNSWWHSGCFQLRGQLTITVLCFRPPSPPTWIKWDVPSLRLEEMTTWVKPFTFSCSINLRNDCRDTDRGQAQLLEKVAILLCMRQKFKCVLKSNRPDLPYELQCNCQGRFLEHRCQQ